MTFYIRADSTLQTAEYSTTIERAVGTAALRERWQ
jgi:hypothetical protein